MAELKVGQTVIFCPADSRNSPTEVTVTAIGRRWVSLASTRHKAEAWYRSALPGRETLATPALAITAAVLERESLVHRIV
jgi:hypothetical protein